MTMADERRGGPSAQTGAAWEDGGAKPAVTPVRPAPPSHPAVTPAHPAPPAHPAAPAKPAMPAHPAPAKPAAARRAPKKKERRPLHAVAQAVVRFGNAHGRLAALGAFVAAAGMIALLVWFTVFSGMAEPPQFVYASF